MRYLFTVFTFLVIFFFSTLVQAQRPKTDKIDEWTQAIMPKAIQEHRDLVSIPCDAYNDDMYKNSDWLRKAFTKRRFAVRILETEKNVPIVFAERITDDRLPTVLFYFHYDGQPVDKRKWDQDDPFTPVIKQKNADGEWEEVSYNDVDSWKPDWRIFARAAADDKAPIVMFLKALDIIQQQRIDQAVNIKVLMDGEEEKGSYGLKSTIDQYKDIYAADQLIIMDGPAHPTNRPTLTFGCRGIASATLIIYGPKVPQHSGHYGNYAPNPAFRASNLLASMKDDNGKVLVKGFYDGIVLDAKTRKILEAVPDDEAYIRSQIGIAAPDQVGKTYQESLQYPSLNIKGMSCAWIGKQTRTIVPDKAIVQLGIRLVKETDGAEMLEKVKKHIEAQGYYVIDREPTEEERLKHPKIATFIGRPSVNAFRTELDSPTGEWLTKSISNVFDEEVVRIRTMGGTIPVTPIIKTLDVPAAIVPMVNMDNNQHSPNENIRVGNLYNGIKICFGILTTSME